MPDSPFIKDVPAAQALDAWRAAREAAGCPERLPAITVPLAEAAGLVTAAPVWAVRSSPPFDAAGMDGIAVRSAGTLGASETTPVWLGPGEYDRLDNGDPSARRPRRGGHARARPLRRRWPRRTARRRPPVSARQVDRRGCQRRRAAAAGRPPAPCGRPGGGGCGWADATVRSEEGFCSYPSHRGRGASDRHRARTRPDPGPELADAPGAGAGGRVPSGGGAV